MAAGETLRRSSRARRSVPAETATEREVDAFLEEEDANVGEEYKQAYVDQSDTDSDVEIPAKKKRKSAGGRKTKVAGTAEEIEDEVRIAKVDWTYDHPFSELSHELIVKIFIQLNMDDIKQFPLVCKQFLSVSRDSHCRLSFLCYHFDKADPVVIGKAWKRSRLLHTPGKGGAAWGRWLPFKTYMHIMNEAYEEWGEFHTLRGKTDGDIVLNWIDNGGKSLKSDNGVQTGQSRAMMFRRMWPRTRNLFPGHNDESEKEYKSAEIVEQEAWETIQFIFGPGQFCVPCDADPVSECLVKAFDLRPELLPKTLSLGYQLSARNIRKILNAVIFDPKLDDAARKAKLDHLHDISDCLKITEDHFYCLLRGELSISCAPSDEDGPWWQGYLDNAKMEFFSQLELENALPFSTLSVVKRYFFQAELQDYNKCAAFWVDLFNRYPSLVTEDEYYRNLAVRSCFVLAGLPADDWFPFFSESYSGNSLYTRNTSLTYSYDQAVQNLADLNIVASLNDCERLLRDSTMPLHAILRHIATVYPAEEQAVLLSVVEPMCISFGFTRSLKTLFDHSEALKSEFHKILSNYTPRKKNIFYGKGFCSPVGSNDPTKLPPLRSTGFRCNFAACASFTPSEKELSHVTLRGRLDSLGEFAAAIFGQDHAILQICLLHALLCANEDLVTKLLLAGAAPCLEHFEYLAKAGVAPVDSLMNACLHFDYIDRIEEAHVDEQLVKEFKEHKWSLNTIKLSRNRFYNINKVVPRSAHGLNEWIEHLQELVVDDDKSAKENNKRFGLLTAFRSPFNKVTKKWLNRLRSLTWTIAAEKKIAPKQPMLERKEAKKTHSDSDEVRIESESSDGD